MSFGLFSPEEVEKIAIELGQYEWDTTNESIQTALTAIQSPQRKDEIMRLIEEIDSLERKISELLNKSFINEVEGVNLSYINSADQLLKEASRKLHYVAQIANLEVFYDRFSQRGNSSSKFSKISFY